MPDDRKQRLCSFSPKGFPTKVSGKGALIKHYAELPDLTGRMEFFDRQAFVLEGTNTLLLKYRGEIEVLPTGRRYDNRYIGFFSFNAAGLIEMFEEYFDPNVLADAWAGDPSSGFGS